MGRKRISNSHWISGALIIILIAVIFFAPTYGWKIRAWLSPQQPENDDAIVVQNDALKAQLAVLQSVSAQLPTSTPNTIRAMVYSRYPMNFRNELLVNAGINEGVTTGTAVMFQGMLLGEVRTVFPDEALVQTIFDDAFKMPVRIGSTGIDGLLQGGSYPMVGSIADTAIIVPGDVIYSAVSGIPYGLPIAQVVATSTSPDSLFQQATLSFPYDINNVQTVLIIK